ncbi:MAG: GIY-YIG nuclease family protein [Alphaproteobacteria bacterium]|nr:GIY-YIG nuclease family protein [Alphaproteobacteria bacterium]
MQPCVYILASRRNGTLYVGMTTNLARRMTQHRDGVFDGFTRRHGVSRLVWVEPQHTIGDAVTRERRIKRWRRTWTLALIERTNPTWRDLYEEFFGPTDDDGAE